MRPEGATAGIGSGRAVLFIVAATLMMSFQDAVVKLVSADLPLWQLFLLRSLVAVPLLVGAVRVLGRGRSLMPRRWGWAMARGTLLVAMYVAFYAALPVLDLATVAAAYYTDPLFITLLTAALIGEPVGPRRLAGIAVGFAGVLVILRPGGDAFSAAMLVPVASALFYAFAAVLARGKCVDESPAALSLALNFAFIAVGAVGSLAVLALDPEQAARYPFLLGRWIAVDAGVAAVLVFLATINVAIHLALARAYQTGTPAVVAAFDYTYLPFAAGWGFVFFAAIPDGPTMAGATMIAGAGIWVVTGRSRR